METVSSIAVGANGISVVENGVTVWTLTWDKIGAIHAYKRDLITTDLLCMDVKVKGTQIYHTIHEEMNGFDRFSEALAKALVLKEPNWRSMVLQEPFQENLTQVF